MEEMCYNLESFVQMTRGISRCGPFVFVIL